MTTESCRYCGVPTREATVLVGDAPGREVKLRISVEPDDGRVIMRKDGSLRLLGDSHFKASRKAGYKVHGASMDECARSLQMVEGQV